jgi:hypothetical protein
MSKAKTKKAPPRKTAAREATPMPPDPAAALAPDDQVIASNLTLHDLFQQQTSAMLERADISDEQKQSILVAMSCPCCGAGGFSFTAKLRKGR